MKRPSDKALVAALRRHRGNAMRAAAELGIASSSLRWRAARIAEAATIIADRRHTRRPRRHTDAEILAAIEEHGSQSAAARALGYAPQAVNARVQLIRAGGGAS